MIITIVLDMIMIFMVIVPLIRRNYIIIKNVDCNYIDTMCTRCMYRFKDLPLDKFHD